MKSHVNETTVTESGPAVHKGPSWRAVRIWPRGRKGGGHATPACLHDAETWTSVGPSQPRSLMPDPLPWEEP